MPRDLGSLRPIDVSTHPEEEDGDYSSPPVDESQPVQQSAPATVDLATDVSPKSVPQPTSNPSPRMPGLQDDAVQRFLLSRISGQVDPKLEAAQRQDRISQLTGNLGGLFAGMGTQMVGGAQAFANAIGGHGYSSPLLEQGAREQAQAFAPQQGAPSAVDRYLQAKKAAQEDSKANLDDAKALVDLQKAQAGTDPNSMAGRKLQLEIDQLEEAKKRDSWGHEDRQTGFGLRQEGNDQKGKSLEETARHNQATELIARERMSLQRQLQSARDQQTKDKLAVQLRRLDDMEEKMGNTEGQGIINNAESQNNYKSGTVAKELNDKIGATVALKQKMAELRGLLKDSRAGLMVPSEAQAKAQALISEMGPLMNNAQSKLSYSGPRAEAIAHAFQDPRSLTGLVKDIVTGGTYTSNNLDELEGIVDNSIRSQATAQGVELGKDYTHTKKTRVGTAKPGRQGSGSGPNELSDNAKTLIEWAKNNKTDPRSASILKKYGVQ